MHTSIRHLLAAFVIAATIITAFVLFASPAGAQTISAEIQAQIRELQAKIVALQEQVRVLLDTRANQASSGGTSATTPVGPGGTLPTESRPVPPVCERLSAGALSMGARGEAVSSLQDFLKEKGFFNAEATGFFGGVTQSAVARWQASEGLESIGVVGPLSRARIAAWCEDRKQLSASPVRGPSPLAVTFHTWLSGFTPPGTSFKIDFGDGSSEAAAHCYAPTDYCQKPGENKHTYTKDGSYVVTLSRVTDPCAGQTACTATTTREAIAKIQITVGEIACTKEYKPVCGAKKVQCITAPCNPVQQTYSNRCMMEADGAGFVHEGSCKDSAADPANDPKCKLWTDGKWCGKRCLRDTPGGAPRCAIPACAKPADGITPSDTAPRCLEYFESNSGTGGNKPPIVTSFSGPTTLKPGEQGTWKILASDPEGGQLTYDVTWGDEKNSPAQAIARIAYDSFVQTTTFTHSYQQSGIYMVVVRAIDSAGNHTRTTATVRVGEIQTKVCTMEYKPVCGRPAGCRNTCPPGEFCAAICQQYDPITYNNRCLLDAAGAKYEGEGECAMPQASSCISGDVKYPEAKPVTCIVDHLTRQQQCSSGNSYYVCRRGAWELESSLAPSTCLEGAPQCVIRSDR